MVRNGCFWSKFESQEIKTIQTKILRVSKKNSAWSYDYFFSCLKFVVRAKQISKRFKSQKIKRFGKGLKKVHFGRSKGYAKAKLSKRTDLGTEGLDHVRPRKKRLKKTCSSQEWKPLRSERKKGYCKAKWSKIVDFGEKNNWTYHHYLMTIYRH